MTDTKPGFGPNPKKLCPMNIINPNLGQDILPNPGGPMSLCTWDKNQSVHE